ncbi:hypothetical protein V6Z11_D11G395700 [Gossypium hirsutum]
MALANYYKDGLHSKLSYLGPLVLSKLQSSQQNSAPTRLYRHCFPTGRPRANYRDFGLSGHILREMVHASLLSGTTRSSW